MNDELVSLKQQLQEALSEIDKLREENAQLKQSATPPISSPVIKPKVIVHQPASSPPKFIRSHLLRKRFHCLGNFSVEERMSIPNVGNQKTTILGIHRSAVMNGIQLIVTNLA